MQRPCKPVRFNLRKEIRKLSLLNVLLTPAPILGLVTLSQGIGALEKPVEDLNLITLAFQVKIKGVTQWARIARLPGHITR